MFCRNCGAEVDKSYVICPSCCVPKYAGGTHCSECGADTSPEDSVCPACKKKMIRNMTQLGFDGERSRSVAIYLGFLLGAFGAHNFYLGYKKRAVLQLIMGLLVFTLPVSFVWAVVETIKFSDKINPVDASGNPLRK